MISERLVAHYRLYSVLRNDIHVLSVEQDTKYLLTLN